MRRKRIWTTAMLSVFIALCCGGGEKDEEPTAAELCMAACAKVQLCDAAAGVTDEQVTSCQRHCADPAAPSDFTVDAIDTTCAKINEFCEDFLYCRDEAKAGAGEEYPAWCEAFCTRCSECITEADFSEEKCKSGNTSECLESCRSNYNYDSATTACQHYFDGLDAAQVSCEELAKNNPFDNGC